MVRRLQQQSVVQRGVRQLRQQGVEQRRVGDLLGGIVQAPLRAWVASQAGARAHSLEGVAQVNEVWLLETFRHPHEDLSLVPAFGVHHGILYIRFVIQRSVQRLALHLSEV